MTVRSIACALLLGLAAPAGLSAPGMAQAPAPADLQSAAEAGDAGAAYMLGYGLIFPVEGEADFSTGRYWLERARAGGDPAAAYALGLMARDGLGGQPDINAAHPLFAEAWRGGFVPAGLALAELDLYAFEGRAATGLAVLDRMTQDEALGPRALLMHAEAVFFGVAEGDEAAAVQRAAQALERDPGLAEAHYLLGVAAIEGVGGPPSAERAREIWAAGARGGDAFSLIALAEAHANGDGGPADPVEALALYGAAAALGENTAQEAATALENSLTPAQRDAAAARREAWLGETG